MMSVASRVEHATNALHKKFRASCAKIFLDLARGSSVVARDAKCRRRMRDDGAHDARAERHAGRLAYVPLRMRVTARKAPPHAPRADLPGAFSA